MKTSLSMTGIYVLLFICLMFILIQGTLSGALDGVTTFRFQNWQWIAFALLGAFVLYMAFKVKMSLLRLAIGIALVYGVWQLI